jgi:uncharacterized membrane protein
VKNTKQERPQKIPPDANEHVPELAKEESENKTPVTFPLPQEAKEPLASTVPETGKEQLAQNVQVEPHLPDLLAGVAIPVEEEERAKEQKSLDQTIHGLLIVGLAISVTLMLVGLFLDLIFRRVIPTTITNPREVFSRVISIRPSGFLSLGLLVLIATPVVRVIGSFIAFVYERDWRYAGITFVVMVVVLLSILIGRG